MKASSLSVGVIVALIVAIATAIYASRPAEQDKQNLAYTSPAYGISFEYPKQYILTEAERGNGERLHHQILLTTETQIPENGEGPTAITIDFFQNDLDREGPQNWITNNSSSNFKLSPDGVITPVVVAGLPAFSYRWSGLYEGDSVVTEKGDWIIMFSVTHMAPADPIRTDFEELIRTVEFH